MEFNHKGHCLFYQTQLPLCVFLFRHECIKVFNIHHPSSNCHSHHQHNMDSCMNVASVQKILYGAAGGSRTLTRFNRRNFEFRAYEPFRHCGIKSSFYDVYQKIQLYQKLNNILYKEIHSCLTANFYNFHLQHELSVEFQIFHILHNNDDQLLTNNV